MLILGEVELAELPWQMVKIKNKNLSGVSLLELMYRKVQNTHQLALFHFPKEDTPFTKVIESFLVRKHQDLGLSS